MKSVMTTQEHFANIEASQIQRSTFDRSRGYKTTLDAGYLYPIFLDEAVPGDTFNVSPTIFGRIATPIHPIMDNIFVDLHFFSVPNRLVWENWKRFNGEQDDPEDSTDYLIPDLAATETGGFGELSIYDYFGLPTKISGLDGINALPLRCYSLIWNEWYRDQNLQSSRDVPKGDGPDPLNTYTLLPRGKRKDYFTSCLPWAQKSDPVSIPLAGSAPVFGHPVDLTTNTGHLWQSNNASRRIRFPMNITPYSSDVTDQYPYPIDSLGPTTEYGLSLGTEGDYDVYPDENVQPPYALLSEATSVSINTLRQAATIQQMFEKDARGGTRYIEIIKSHFNVTSPDARLQRPEFLGGSSAPITMHPIPQQSETTENSPQGNLAAMGTLNVSGRGFVKTFTEHEYIIGLISVRADLTYQTGIHKLWSRQTRFDFYWPTFANLGEQAVLNKEIYAQGTSADDDVFGYQERYAEYRFSPSQITGRFRSNATGSLDVWHLSQDFGSLPSLNEAFIRDEPPVDRVIQTPEEPQFIIDCYFNCRAARPMPVYSTPGIKVL